MDQQEGNYVGPSKVGTDVWVNNKAESVRKMLAYLRDTGVDEALRNYNAPGGHDGLAGTPDYLDRLEETLKPIVEFVQENEINDTVIFHDGLACAVDNAVAWYLKTHGDLFPIGTLPGRKFAVKLLECLDYQGIRVFADTHVAIEWADEFKATHKDTYDRCAVVFDSGKGGQHAMPLDSVDDDSIKDALLVLEEQLGRSLELDPRTDFPSFTIYINGIESGGG